MARFFLLGLFALAGLASGAVISFDSVVNGTSNVDRTTPLTTQGYTFTSAHFHVIDNPSACVPQFAGCSTVNGTQYLASDAPQLGFPVVMTRQGGGTFNLNSLQASRLFVDGTASALVNFPNADTLELVGALSGGGTVSVSISLPALPSFNSFSLPGTFVNLLSLTISGSVPGLTDNASWAVDNIDVSDVPEPSTVLLVAGGALLLGLRKYHQ